MSRTNAELLDACLDLLQVGDRDTLNALLDEDLWIPMGCGCCAYTPGIHYRSFGDNVPTDGFIRDDDGVTWLANKGSWKERNEP